jgi:hypothetical protein
MIFESLSRPARANDVRDIASSTIGFHFIPQGKSKACSLAGGAQFMYAPDCLTDWIPSAGRFIMAHSLGIASILHNILNQVD